MRPIHIARLDKPRPVLLLTRDVALAVLRRVTVAPITSTVRGIATEIPVGAANHLDREGVVSLDNVQTIRTDDLGRQVGWLLWSQEQALTAALHAAFDLNDLD